MSLNSLMTSTTRYSKVAIILHWCIAIGILAMLISGLLIYQEWLSDAALFRLFQWHKSLGVVLLLLIILRILWRLLHSPPKLPSTFNTLQLRASTFGHIALYLLLVLMPMSGWLIVSTSELQVPTLVFNVFKWSHIPVPELFVESSHTIANSLHFYGSIIFTALITGHIAMVFKHRQQGINLLSRMPFTRISLSIVVIFVMIIFTLSLNTTSSTPSQALSSSNQTGEIQFNGVHAGNDFSGQFQQWTLNTRFDPKTQSLNAFELVINASSFTTGNTFYDETLREEDWFDPDNYPEISFIASNFNQLSSSETMIVGTLTVKNTQVPLEFTATINDQNRIDTTFTLSRLQLGLGRNADPDAEWVDDNIELKAWSQLN